MGWVPKVGMRSIKEGFKLLQKSGIPKEVYQATVTTSGVYTVLRLKAENQNAIISISMMIRALVLGIGCVNGANFGCACT